MVEFDADGHLASDRQRLVFIELRSRSKDLRNRQDDQPMDEREDVHIWRSVEFYADGGEVRHRVRVRGEHDCRTAKLTNDDDKADSPDAGRVSPHEGLAIS